MAAVAAAAAAADGGREEARREAGPEELSGAPRGAPRSRSPAQYLSGRTPRGSTARRRFRRACSSARCCRPEGRRAPPVVRLAEERRPAAGRDLDRARGARADPGAGEVGDVGAERLRRPAEAPCRGRASRRRPARAEAGGRRPRGRWRGLARSRRAGRRRRRFPTSRVPQLVVVPAERRRAAPVARLGEERRHAAGRDLDRAGPAGPEARPLEVGDVLVERLRRAREVRVAVERDAAGRPTARPRSRRGPRRRSPGRGACSRGRCRARSARGSGRGSRRARRG